ncbi:MAG: NAD(P)-dependent oxidoreductase [Bryobacterales bacterium]
MGSGHQRRRRTRAAHVRLDRSARQRHHPDQQPDRPGPRDRRPRARHAALAHPRDPALARAQGREKKWQATPRDLYELRGKTAIVIGVGGIGMQISQRAWAFGMTVIGVDPEDIPFSPFVSRVVKPDQLDDVLPLADVVFMSAPHTEKTNKMIGPNQFERMKKGSWFIAVSRGKTYDLSALIKSLDSGHLKGAGVDVVEREPLESTSALWEFPNVIITPHIAGRSDMDRDRMLGTVKENIRRFAEGLPLLNVVDKQKGY